MKPIEFDGQTTIFAKDQPEYQPLPAHAVLSDVEIHTISRDTCDGQPAQTVHRGPLNCIDVAADAVWIGKDYLCPCVNVELCRVNGCYWRKFHQLTAEQFVRRG